MKAKFYMIKDRDIEITMPSLKKVLVSANSNQEEAIVVTNIKGSTNKIFLDSIERSGSWQEATEKDLRLNIQQKNELKEKLKRSEKAEKELLTLISENKTILGPTEGKIKLSVVQKTALEEVGWCWLMPTHSLVLCKCGMIVHTDSINIPCEQEHDDTTE